MKQLKRVKSSLQWRSVRYKSLLKKPFDNNCIRLYYWDYTYNVGDIASQAIVNYVTRSEIHKARSDEHNKLLAIGSIISSARSGDIIWGSGAISDDVKMLTRRILPLAVRGPLTRNILLRNSIECPEIYGDPGILVSKVFPSPQTTKIYKVGIVKHYIDKSINIFVNDRSIKLIDTQQPLENFVKDINQCEIIFSSSLHGIIFAESYGIPAFHLKISNNVYGGSFKFQDYYLGSGRGNYKFFRPEDILKDHNWEPPQIDHDRLVKSLLCNLK